MTARDAISAAHASMPMAGVVLAGGLSRRMGTNKAFITLGGRPLLTHVIERLRSQLACLAINSNVAEAEMTAEYGLPVIADHHKGYLGPLAALSAAFTIEKIMDCKGASHVLTMPVDTPFVPLDLVARLKAAITAPQQIIIARSQDRSHPVIGLFPFSLANALDAWMRTRDNMAINAFLEAKDVVHVDFTPVETDIGPLDPFFNINRPDDLLLAERYYQALMRTKKML